MIEIICLMFLGGQFALSATTPRSVAPLRSAPSLWGNRCDHGRRLFGVIKFRYNNLVLWVL